MPKRKRIETPQEQSERFKREAQELIDAGVLSPTEAESGLDQFVREKAPKKGTGDA